MTVLMSLWRSDMERQIKKRADHLLSKTSVKDNIRWLWAVGDSNDSTEQFLLSYSNPVVTVVRCDSGVTGDGENTIRRRRSAFTASQMFTHLREDDDYACLHESDLCSPVDVIDQLFDNPLPCAAWPVIQFHDRTQFYDIWAYRSLQGQLFHSDTTAPTGRFQVSSFGSCWMAPAQLVKDRMLDDEAVVGLCKQWVKEGIKLWVNPTIVIHQPVDLWEPR